MCSGPSTGAALNWNIRRVVAVTATLSLLTLGLSVPPTTASITAAATPDPGAAAVSFDYDAEARALDLAARAARNARADTAVKTGLGSVEAATPKTASATKKTPPKKKAASTQAPGKSTGTGKATDAGRKPAVPVKVSGNVAKVVAYANAQVGKRYVFGTAGPSTFDCSGLAVAAYRQIGISLPHQTTPLATRGRAVSRSELRPGDLVFPSSGHVGIYVGNGMIVHASTPKGGVKKSTIYTFWKARRIVG